jgi:hypothetical protein
MPKARPPCHTNNTFCQLFTKEMLQKLTFSCFIAVIFFQPWLQSITSVETENISVHLQSSV